MAALLNVHVLCIEHLYVHQNEDVSTYEGLPMVY